MKKNNLINKIINIFLICMCTIEVGMAIGYYMLVNIDFNKYNNEYIIEVLNN